MPDEPWSDTETNILITRYGTHGPTLVAQQLNRTIASVKAKAYALDLQFGIVTGWVQITHIANYLNLTPPTIRADANKANIPIKQCANGREGQKIDLVPKDWADEYIMQKEETLAADELVDSYYTLPTVAKAFGVSVRLVKSWLAEEDSVLSGVKRVQASGRHGSAWLLDPWGVEAAARRYRRAERK